MKKSLFISLSIVLFLFTGVNSVFAKTANNSLLKFNVKEISSEEESKLKESLQEVLTVMGKTLYMANVHYEGYDLSNLFALANSYINTDGEEYKEYSSTISQKLKNEILNHNQKVTEVFNKKINNLEKVNYDYSVYATKNKLGYRINKKISGELFTFLGQNYKLK